MQSAVDTAHRLGSGCLMLAASVLLTCFAGARAAGTSGGAASSAPGDALDPRAAAFNAVPDDGVDDREALQEWIDAGCRSPAKVLYLPPGDWHVTRTPLPGVSNIGSLRITCDGLTVLGSGRASRIVMQGTAMLPSNFRGPADWWVFDIRGSGTTLAGIALDGSQRSNTGEQTHLIQIVGPARDTVLRQLHLNLPVLAPPSGSVGCKPAESEPEFETRMCVVPGHGSVLCKDLGDRPRCSLIGGVYTVLGWFQGGDCIRTLGEVTRPVDGVSVTDSFAAECDRSFLALQRASYNLTISRNTTRKVTDQVIDQEPTGTGGIGKVIITDNRFERGGAAAQGASAISLSGNGPGAEMGDAMIVAGNIIDGGIHTYNVSRISIEHNLIRGHPQARNAEAVVKIIKYTDGLRLIGNEIERPAGGAAGSVVQLGVHGSGWPIDVTIALNTIRQSSDAGLIDIAGAQQVSILDNTLHCNQPTPGSFPAIRGQSAKAASDNPATPEMETAPVPLENLIVARNRARGVCRTLVQLVPPGGVAVGAVTVTDNQTKGFRTGVEFTGTLLPSVKPRITDNLFEGTPPGSFVTGPPGFAFDGSNGPR